MKKLIMLIMLIVLVSLSACSKTPDPVKVSSPIKTSTVQSSESKEIDFELPSLNGEKIKLSGLLGKTVVLNFFATWCPPCKAEIPGFLGVMKSMKDDSSIKFLFVDTQEDLVVVKEFIKAQKYEAMNPLLDVSGSVSTKYGITGIPTTFIIDKAGNVAVHHVGYMDEAALKSAIKEVSGK
jgi:thiol-disulfide isomerase/thioredoxin